MPLIMAIAGYALDGIEPDPPLTGMPDAIYSNLYPSLERSRARALRDLSLTHRSQAKADQTGGLPAAQQQAQPTLFDFAGLGDLNGNGYET